jgi:YfiH family protein
MTAVTSSPAPAPSPARFHGEPPRYLTLDTLVRARLPHVFTTRHFPGASLPRPAPSPFGGEAAALLAEAGLDHQSPAFARQVHGAEVLVADRAGLTGTGDVLVTDRPGLPLAIFTADCLAIIAYDARRRRLAVAHAGWRGTAQGTARAAALAAAGTGRAADVVAAIGPSIGPCCYEVDQPVIDHLAAAYPDRWASWVTPRGVDAGGEERWLLDLWKANEDQLVEAGVDPSHIDNPRLCTACRTDLFLSYRRGARGARLAAVAAAPL